MMFASWSEFFAMGHHGLYVWSAYGLCALVLGVNVLGPWRARRRYLQAEARRWRQENRP